MNKHSNTILIIEDDAGLCELIASILEENGLQPVCVNTAMEALGWLNGNSPLLAIIDYGLPDMNGKQLIAELQKKTFEVPPFIVATGQGDERVAVEMMKLGAYDYIVKDRNFLDMIFIVVHRVIREIAKERELNADKDRFMSILAHDLKGPFSLVVGLSEVFVDRLKQGDYNELETYAETIKDSSQRVMDLLSNLIEWSRSQTGRMDFNPEKLDVNLLTSEILELLSCLAAQKSISIHTEIPANYYLFADKAMIGTVLRNLISNAVKFTPKGGKIDIIVEGQQNETRFQVKDNGVGISETAIKKLFRIDEKYTTPGTQNELGTGFGLILCKEFVEKHGGKIWVESKKGKGSTFYFTITYQ